VGRKTNRLSTIGNRLFIVALIEIDEAAIVPRSRHSWINPNRKISITDNSALRTNYIRLWTRPGAWDQTLAAHDFA